MDTNTTLNLDLWTLIQQGAISTYPLLLCSVILLGVVLERAWSLRGIIRSTAHLTRDVVPVLARGDWQGAVDVVRKHRACPAGAYTAISSGERTCRFPSWSASRPSAASRRSREPARTSGCWARSDRRRPSSASSTVRASSAPSTRSRARRDRRLRGGRPASQALIATALGLAVGIVAVIFYNYFQSRVDRIDAALRIGSGRVLEAVSAGRRVPHGVQ
jgi:hypothetical protein